jgi:hypothetical protein
MHAVVRILALRLLAAVIDARDVGGRTGDDDAGSL